MNSFIKYLKLFAFALVILIFFIKCSDDSDDGLAGCQTFQECNDLTMWKYFEGDKTNYLMIVNNRSLIENLEFDNMKNCYNRDTKYSSAFNMEVLESSTKRLQIKLWVSGYESLYELHTYSTESNLLTLKMEFYSGGNSTMNDVKIYSKSDVEFEELTICN